MSELDKNIHPLINESGEEPFKLHAEDWNSIVQFFARRANLMFGGKLVDAGPPHPWNINCRWNYIHNQFTFSIDAGFIRGHASYVTTYESLTEERTRERRGIEKNVGEDSVEPVNVPITDNPQIPIANDAWVNVVTLDTVEFDDERQPPEILRYQMNILEAQKGRLNLATQTLTIDDSKQRSQDLETARLLKRIEVYVRVYRTSVTVAKEFGVVADGHFEQLLEFTDAKNTPPELFLSPQSPVEMEEGKTLTDALNFEDDGFDLKHIATIWLCGPQGELHNLELNDLWLPVVEYTTFYNLDHSVNAEALDVPPLRIINPAAALSSGFLAQAEVDHINDMNRQTEEIYAKTSISGMFWTV